MRQNAKFQVLLIYSGILLTQTASKVLKQDCARKTINVMFSRLFQRLRNYPRIHSSNFYNGKFFGVIWRFNVEMIIISFIQFPKNIWKLFKKLICFQKHGPSFFLLQQLLQLWCRTTCPSHPA